MSHRLSAQSVSPGSSATLYGYFYDPHWHGVQTMDLPLAAGGTAAIRHQPVGARCVGSGAVFAVDEYCSSRIPFFYPRWKRLAVLADGPMCTRQVSETSLARRFDLVLTHRADLIVRGPPFARVDFGTSTVSASMATGDAVAKDRLLSFVGSIEHPRVGGYPLRREVASALAARGLADCFGRGIRPVPCKTEALVPYCFSVAMENLREDYYFTEKLIDCFLCETVPIYWGCPSIGQIFDRRGIITFERLDDLLQHVAELSFERYAAMRPYVLENKRRCREQDLDSCEGWFRRLMQAALARTPGAFRPLRPWQVSKPMQAIRMLADRVAPHARFPL